MRLQQAQAMGRPKGAAVLVSSSTGQVYEVVRLRGGGHKVFRLELVALESDSEECQGVLDALSPVPTKSAPPSTE